MSSLKSVVRGLPQWPTRVIAVGRGVTPRAALLVSSGYRHSLIIGGAPLHRACPPPAFALGTDYSACRPV